MVRMQVLGLGLLLMLSWAGWASSARVDPRKITGKWYHIFTASNKLEELRELNYLRLYGPNLIVRDRAFNTMWLSFEYRYLEDCKVFSFYMLDRLGRIFETSFRGRNIIETVDATGTMLILGYIKEHQDCNDYTVLALGREHTLNDADMKKFQKVLQDNGIREAPVHFTDDDSCR